MSSMVTSSKTTICILALTLLFAFPSSSSSIWYPGASSAEKDHELIKFLKVESESLLDVRTIEKFGEASEERILRHLIKFNTNGNIVYEGQYDYKQQLKTEGLTEFDSLYRICKTTSVDHRARVNIVDIYTHISINNVDSTFCNGVLEEVTKYLPTKNVGERISFSHGKLSCLTRYKYDARNILIEETFWNGNGEEDSKTRYNPNGNILDAAHSYDAKGRLAKYKESKTLTHTCRYSNDGFLIEVKSIDNRIEVTDYGLETVTYYKRAFFERNANSLIVKERYFEWKNGEKPVELLRECITHSYSYYK